ncbi:hypothetical protein [Mucilaginibacter lappiensis]|jgi:hypothetical protein|uniref:hypothetical protein n=1 Tax=Mucilaginibacter lappiensis TaxID=354630 RepID=UPI003D1ED309
MKIITLHSAIHTNELYNLLQQKLNQFFHERRQSNINFIIERKGDTIEISQPEMYEGFLFSIVVNGTQLQITRSEHYVNDVNSLTIESILNHLFKDLSGSKGTDLVQEG